MSAGRVKVTVEETFTMTSGGADGKITIRGKAARDFLSCPTCTRELVLVACFECFRAGFLVSRRCTHKLQPIIGLTRALTVSETGPYEGTLLVNPLLSRATAYFLLRPFLSPKRAAACLSSESYTQDFLSPENWQLDLTNSWLHGATPGRGQELQHSIHPHLDLPKSMIHVPRVNPGDYVAWHCDTVHAVDRIHAGHADSSVMYIPACPLTVSNAEFLARQRECFINGTSCPDFGGGKGESEHVGRPGVEDVRAVNEVEGMQAFGLREWDSSAADLTYGQREVMDRANKILGFYD